MRNPRARDGSIFFDGHDITHLPTHEIARLKLAQAPEGRRIFSRMTVLENLQMGATVSEPKEFDRDLDRVLVVVPAYCKQRLGQRGGTLSGGEQQMLAIARALMSRPRLLLLDEPSLGLAPLIVRQIFDAIRTLNKEDGLTVFLVEQNAYHALNSAHRGYVMVNGLITLSGTGRELLDGLKSSRPISKEAALNEISEPPFRRLDAALRGTLVRCIPAGHNRAGWRGGLLAGRAIATNLAAGMADCLIWLHPGRRRAFHSFQSVRRDLSVTPLLSGRRRILHRFGFLGFRTARAAQMVTQYRWLNESPRPDALASKTGVT